MNPERQRARRDDEKEARRRALLDAARARFAGTSYDQVRMVEVAADAGLSKATAFFYFATKESLFLALLEEQLAEWLTVLDGELEAGGRWSGARVARIFATTLAARGDFTRLLTVLSTVLEHNVDEAQVLRFKNTLLHSMGSTGALLERRLDLAAGEGGRLLLRIDAVVVGLRQLADAAPVVATVLARPEMAPLRVDFAAELEAVLTLLFAGLAR
jgi:AcrR family transcriptional regulator